MVMDNYYCDDELKRFGIKRIGENVKISKKASLYGCEQMEFGSNVRIDDFCVLSGKLVLGNNVFIGCFTLLAGGDEGIYLADFSTCAYRVSVFTRSDDYSGETLTNSTISEKYRNQTTKKPIYIERHVIVGAGSVILPGAHLEEGVSIGAMSLVTKPTEPWSIYVGIPAQKIKDRKKDLLEQEKVFLAKSDLS